MQHLKSTLATAFLIFSSASWADVDLNSFAKNLPQNVPPTERSTIIGIFDSCGSASNIEDGCAISGLQQAASQNNVTAKTLLDNYQQVQGFGNMTNPECQVASHQQANKLIGHCVLMMDYFAIKDNDPAAAVGKYDNCLVASMQELTFNGNIVAQYFMSQLYGQRGVPQAAEVWKRALLMKQDTDEYKLLMKCYQ